MRVLVVVVRDVSRSNPFLILVVSKPTHLSAAVFRLIQGHKSCRSRTVLLRWSRLSPVLPWLAGALELGLFPMLPPSEQVFRLVS